MLFRIFAAFAGLTLLCSCNTVMLSGTESLLVAPKLNKRQAEVSQALESSLSLSSIIYKYPQSGEHRSPIIFYDFNGDGLEDAIVFYTPANDETGGVRAKILAQRPDSTWQPFYDILPQSSQIDFVKFEKLLSDSPPCLLIGWQGEGRRASALGIYSMKNGSFRREANLSYTSYAVGDFDGDGLSEVIVVAPDGNGRYFVSLSRERGGHIGVAGEMPLCGDVRSVRSFTTGRLDFSPRSTALYIDEMLAEGPTPTIATEVLRVGADGLTLLVGGEPSGPQEPESQQRINYELTFRGADLYCTDFNGDGVVELPYPVPSPSQDFMSASSLPVVQLLHLTPEGFDLHKTAVLNTTDNYLVYYPERWDTDLVVAERDQDAAELRFRKYNAETEITEEELLRIRVSSTRNNPDLLDENNGYTELFSRGTTLYSAYIPNITGEALAVTKGEVMEMFLPLAV